ncbi:MAG: glycosyltransferase family 2 protein [Sphingobium sp.]
MQGTAGTAAQPLVSVVIPAFNSEETLERAVASVLAQSVDLEILVVDDASTDGTGELAARLAKGDERIRLLRNPTNSGPAVSRNAGFAAAQGRWIATLDADDAYLPDRLARMVATGDRYQADIIADNLMLFDWSAQQTAGTALRMERGMVKPVLAAEYVAQSITGRTAFDYGQLKPIFRRAFLDNRGLRYPDLRHGEDFALMLDCLLADARFALMSDAFYLFTQRIGPLSSDPSGQTRTTLNLRAMHEHTLSLLARPRVRKDQVLSSLLRKRAEAILFQQSWNKAYPFLRARRPVRLAMAMMSDWRNWPMLVLHLTRRQRTRYS